MGSGESKEATHRVTIVTADKRGAGATGIDVSIAFIDAKGRKKIETITGFWNHRFKRNEPKMMELELGELGRVTSICISREDDSESHTWYVDRVEVQKLPPSTQSAKRAKPGKEEMKVSIFPVNRWIKAISSLNLEEFDSLLPQDDPNHDQRVKELRERRQNYVLSGKIMGAPPQVETVPQDEKFSIDYGLDFVDTAVTSTIEGGLVNITTGQFDSLDDFCSVYKHGYDEPKCMKKWIKNPDIEFGRQKLSGCNPVLIELCKKIPENFAVTSKMVAKFLEGKSLPTAMSKNRIFKIDLAYMADITCTDDRPMPGPMCLLYQKNNDELVPVAIQLMPKPAGDNPVFTPDSPRYTWLAAQMWFNLADCSHHQSATHLGFTHLLMESVAVCTNRRLSPSHPIYKLLAPHFLYVMPINALAVNHLVSVGGWVDTTMQIGRNGMFDIIRKKWKKWDLQKDGNLRKNLKERGVDQKGVLPDYPYRDDALLLWDAIEKYVSTVVNNVYDSPEKMKEDYEISEWCRELAESADFGGVESSCTSNEQLIEMVTVFIFIGSVGHAAANFEQYDQYGFPPTYPSLIHGERPTNAKKEMTELELVQQLATRKETVSVMEITRILTQKETNSLGYFEVQYAYDPMSEKALKEFQKDLKLAASKMKERNEDRSRKYKYLLPKNVPNAVSI